MRSDTEQVKYSSCLVYIGLSFPVLLHIGCQSYTRVLLVCEMTGDACHPVWCSGTSFLSSFEILRINYDAVVYELTVKCFSRRLTRTYFDGRDSRPCDICSDIQSANYRSSTLLRKSRLTLSIHDSKPASHAPTSYTLS